jgi:hypothetical protein
MVRHHLADVDKFVLVVVALHQINPLVNPLYITGDVSFTAINAVQRSSSGAVSKVLWKHKFLSGQSALSILIKELLEGFLS